MDLQARASDQDREATVRRLQQAFADGRLAPEELEQRVERALTAVSHGDLFFLTTDLPERPGEVVTISSKASKITRSGQWRVPRVLRIESAYGHPYLDLSEALVEYPEIVFELNLKYGSADITLPRGASADTNDVHCEWGSVQSQVAAVPTPGRLHLRVSGKFGYGKLRIRYGGARKVRWFGR